MYCGNCNQSVPDDSAFCPECGAPTSQQPQWQPSPASAPQQPQWQPPPASGPPPPSWQGSTPVTIPNYLVWSILSTLFCCLPIGVVGIIYAAQANSKQALGDYVGAANAAKNAKVWCWAAFGSGVVVMGIYLLVLVGSSGTTEF